MMAGRLLKTDFMPHKPSHYPTGGGRKTASTLRWPAERRAKPHVYFDRLSQIWVYVPVKTVGFVAGKKRALRNEAAWNFIMDLNQK